MATGKEHDQGILVFTVVVGAVTYYFTKDIFISFLMTAGHLVGGLFLSPDLDLASLAYYRWGFFKGVWKPYQSVIPHRSWFFHRNVLSHAPIVGSLGRVLYLGVIVFFVLWLIDNAAKTTWGVALWNFLNKNRLTLIYLFLGLEVSAWVHLAMDIAATNWSKSRRRRSY